MSNTYNNAPFLPASIILPDDANAMRIRLLSYLNEIAYKLNKREIASYDPVELQTGQDWFSSNSRGRRQSFRKVIEFPTVTGTATTSVAHNLGPLTNITFTEIRGTLNLPGTPLFAAMPQGAPDEASITIDANNVNITLSNNTYNGAYGIVVLEYLRN